MQYDTEHYTKTKHSRTSDLRGYLLSLPNLARQALPTACSLLDATGGKETHPGPTFNFFLLSLLNHFAQKYKQSTWFVSTTET